MRHIKDIFNFQEKDPLKGLAPVGTKDCEGRCQREVIRTEDGTVIICKGCDRIVMDNRK
jgi:hypothetical protein